MKSTPSSLFFFFHTIHHSSLKYTACRWKYFIQLTFTCVFCRTGERRQRRESSILSSLTKDFYLTWETSPLVCLWVLTPSY